MNSRNQYTKNQYLLRYDLIAKYNQKSSLNIPKLNSIKIVVPLKDKAIASFQNKIYVLFYLFSSYKPVISVKKNQSLKDKKMVNNYFLTIKLSSKRNIDTFLFSFFIENFFMLEKENFNLLDSSKIFFNSSAIDKKIIVFNKLIDSSLFSELENLFSTLFPNIFRKELNFHLNFHFTKPRILNLKNKDSFLKNYLFFWSSK